VASATVRTPATSANLGSGFDTFGLALGLYNQISAELADGGQWHVQVVGEGEHDEGLLTDDRVVAAMKRLFAEAGRPELSARVFCRNAVPIGHGLGSSAAAIVGGLMVANALVSSPFGTHEIFQMAAELEGHPDNVAAALVGGFTMCWGDGSAQYARVEPVCGLAVVCVGSDRPLTTRKARELLPASVPHADAAFNVGRAGLLTAGIALGRRDLIGPGTADRLHEPYRLSAVPDLDAVREALLVAGADGAALSGSGPTVIGLVCGKDDAEGLERAQSVAAEAGRLLEGVAGRLTPAVYPVDRVGATLLA
jgi:homoserine kinase